MIANPQELMGTLRSLIILEKSLAALRGQLAAANPDLLAATAPTDTQRIITLQAEIANCLYANPSDVSQRVATLPAEVPAV